MKRKEFYNSIDALLQKSGVKTGRKTRLFLAFSWKKHDDKLKIHLSDVRGFSEIIHHMKNAKTYTKYRLIVNRGLWA